MVELFSLSMFRRHVLRCAQQLASAGENGDVLSCLDNAKVGQGNTIVRANQDVAGLDVSVDETLVVGVGQRIRYLIKQLHRSFQAKHAFLLDNLLQCSPRQVLHGDVVDAVLFAHFVDGGDVGMLQVGSGDGLLLEAFDETSIGGEMGQHHLQGDGTLKGGINGFVDDGHSALAYLANDFILAQLLAN